MATEAEINMAQVSPKTQAIIKRWMTDIAYVPPEAYEWRWSIIAQELEGLLNDDR